LYVIIRKDLSIAQQMMQGAHAAIEFQHEHPEIAKLWNEHSKYLVFLSVENESELEKYIQKFEYKMLKYSVFREPDIGDEITAVAVEPGDVSRRLCSKLPLALK
jgi:peptidyl-tRNA hydrolase